MKNNKEQFNLIKALKNLVKPASSRKTKNRADYQPSWMYKNE